MVLLLGLCTTWLDYRLNLANDLERDLADLRARADATGFRLAQLAENLLPKDNAVLLRLDLAASTQGPDVEIAAVMNADGILIEASNSQFAGSGVAVTPLASSAELARHTPAKARVLHTEDKARIYGAYPVGQTSHWVLLSCDRAPTILQARIDAARQLRWTAASIGLLCLALWAAMHFGFADRIHRVASMVEEFGAQKRERIIPISGGDEVAELSQAFASMSERVSAQEKERVTLERELVEAGERERRRIGRELHDGLGQRLIAAAMVSNSLADALAKDSPESARATEIARQLRETVVDARRLSHGLAPVALEGGGLAAALEELAEFVSQTGKVRVVVEANQTDLGRHSEQVLLHLFRIAQEAVSNSLKHANSREIRIGLMSDPQGLTMEVEDDGEGMQGKADGQGMGLRVMRHRAELIGGTLEITSSPAGGTLVRVRLPNERNDV